MTMWILLIDTGRGFAPYDAFSTAAGCHYARAILAGLRSACEAHIMQVLL